MEEIIKEDSINIEDNNIIETYKRLFPSTNTNERASIEKKVKEGLKELSFEGQKIDFIISARFFGDMIEASNVKDYKRIYRNEFLKLSFKDQVLMFGSIAEAVELNDYLFGTLVNKRRVPMIYNPGFEYTIMMAEFSLTMEEFVGTEDLPSEDLLDYMIEKIFKKAIESEMYNSNLTLFFFESVLSTFEENIYWITNRTNIVEVPDEIAIINDFIKFNNEVKEISNFVYQDIVMALSLVDDPEIQSLGFGKPTYLLRLLTLLDMLDGLEISDVHELGKQDVLEKESKN